MKATPWIATVDGARHGCCAPSDLATADTPPRRYESRFGDWYTAAAVRSHPPIEVSDSERFLCFPPELAPLLRHPVVRALGSRTERELLMQYLFSYLTFTDRLEDEVVNRAARRLATRVGLSVSPSMQLDAYKIYCDEGYHSLFSAELMAQLSARHEFAYDGGSGHPALAFFHEQRSTLDSATRYWFDLFFAIVSETLISASLLRIPHAVGVLPAVRQLVADHASDEWRHHAFFAQVCQLAWPRIPDSVRRVIGPLIPRCILAFLSPDTPALLAFLSRRVGQHKAADILADSYPASEMRDQARFAARASVRVFQQAGLFEDARTAEAFSVEGLGVCHLHGI